jgi:putative DNA primase/helicase
MTPYELWKEKAEESPLLTVAQMFGAKLKRHGTEWTGPCPYCGGKDRFSINAAKSKWHCRGFGGGRSPITLAAHIGNLPWKAAAEQLAGPCPSGPARPLSDAEQAERAKRLQQSQAAQRAREAQQMQQEENSREAAKRIWDASKPIDGTLAQTYLYTRGIPPFQTDVFRFHAALPYPGKPKPFPALICRVDDMGGDLCAVWRIYLRGDGRKADVENAKLGLGPAGGGAVRIGGNGPRIGLAEGVESALGAWNLIGRQYPVWAALSTSGLVGIELPLGIQRVTIFPDGDRPIKKQGEEFVPAIPAGRKAAHSLRDRLAGEGLNVTVAAEPAIGRDYLDIWSNVAKEVA